MDVGAVVILDAVDVDPARGGLIKELSHRRLGNELRDSLGSILETKTERSDALTFSHRRQDGHHNTLWLKATDCGWSIFAIDTLIKQVSGLFCELPLLMTIVLS